ncbi:unnamed protein product [Parascedosporium putredinis]|uniref:3-hydroxyacyl-CoA dehydrogenase NAD binding domain-containing protein n=1 Tax=Parascedosporium putredinis TaxID=1442378 RepID=A0A9P1GTW9_9PEZI|nr:unnamed protein product [Parascedosporium putredinis]CAI7987559.1 unnamed protein product [Parascedosporium putredinis]
MATPFLRLQSRGLGSQLRSFSSTSRQNAATVKSLGVIGSGQMGLGIALVAAQKAGVPVTLVDTSKAALDKGLAFADKLLAKDVSKSRITQEQADKARSLLTSSTSIEDLGDIDFVIEAVPEIPQLKFDIFAKLAEVCPKHAILATNTSSISITRIAAATTKDPKDTSASSRVVSTHFMNPVPVQKGVEIISGLQTSPETLETAVEFCKAMGKIASAVICLETGVGDRDSIDSIMKNGTNVPMGPLQLADFIGLDTCLAIMRVLYEETADSKYRPSVLLKKMVDAGWLGKKSGRGFYEY